MILISGAALTLSNFFFGDVQFNSVIGMIYYFAQSIFTLDCAFISYRIYKKDIGNISAELSEVNDYSLHNVIVRVIGIWYNCEVEKRKNGG